MLLVFGTTIQPLLALLSCPMCLFVCAKQNTLVFVAYVQQCVWSQTRMDSEGSGRPAELSVNTTWPPTRVLPRLANGHWSAAFLRHHHSLNAHTHTHSPPNVAPFSCPSPPPPPLLPPLSASSSSELLIVSKIWRCKLCDHSPNRPQLLTEGAPPMGRQCLTAHF